MTQVNKADLPSDENTSYAHGSAAPNNHKNQAEEDELEIPIGNLTYFIIWKDVIVLSLGFFCNFSAYWGLANLQSSLNNKEGLGSTSLAIVSACVIISSFALTTSVIIKYLKCKWTLVACILVYGLSISANFYATWYTMIPASILTGFASTSLWTVKATYLMTLSKQYARLSKETLETINSRFFGVFYLILYFGNCIGNAISSIVLTPIDEDKAMNEPLHAYNICGKAYCNEDLRLAYSYKTNETFNNTPTNTPAVLPESNSAITHNCQFYILVGIYTALCISGAIIIATFLRPLKGFRSATTKLQGIQLLKVTLRQLANPVQLAIMPLTIFSGLFQAFLITDYNTAFTNCILGIHYIGYTVICTAAFTASFSLLFGLLLKHVHRSFVYGFAALISVCLYITGLIWAPATDMPWVYFVISGLWGIAESVWMTHLFGFYGILFPENLDVSYSSHKLWESVGFMIGFLWASTVCMKVKLCILLALLILGMLGYIVVEIRLFLSCRALQQVES